MHRMTRVAGPAEIRAPFDRAVYAFKGERATMLQANGERFLRLSTRKRGEQLFRITKVIGGRYREDFVGIEVASLDMGAPVVARAVERVMPVSYLLFDGSWRYKGYSVLIEERDRLDVGATWRQTCIDCHNTVPFVATVYDDVLGDPSSGGELVAGDGAARPTRRSTVYQGSVSDQLLPAARQWTFGAGDAAALRAAVLDEMDRLGRRAPGEDALPLTRLLQDAIATTRQRFDQQHFVEIGVGCEACHNGSREHVEHPARRPSFALTGGAIAVKAPPGPAAPSAAQWVNHTCVRCHTVLFSRYPYTWEGGARDHAPGGSTINSGEARDYLLGGCASQMSCADCHDPHGEDDRARLDAMATVAENGRCTRCHKSLASEAALRGHTHHAATSEGSACVACHMPRKNMGLAYRLTRYHNIGSPTDRARVEGDRPVECALCHVDRTVIDLVTTMERWWQKRYDRGALTALYGDLGDSALAATLRRGKPHEQAAAAIALADHGVRARIDDILPVLESPYPLVRYYARHALETLTGKPVAIDVDLDPVELKTAIAKWRSAQER